MSLEIRPFQEIDRAAVIGLWEACGLIRSWNDPNKDIDRKIGFQPELFFIGKAEGKLVASAMCGYDGHRGSVFYLGVHPDYQRQAFGRDLMAYVEKQLINIGCPKLNILVRSTNLSVLEFYQCLDYCKDEVASLGKRLIADG